jgi:alcohol dehydrogenase YqhD (iron-dependent ADH family)
MNRDDPAVLAACYAIGAMTEDDMVMLTPRTAADFLTEYNRTVEAWERRVFCVWKQDDDAVHIFSTKEKQEDYVASLECNTVLYDYIVDEPSSMYARHQ